MSLKMHAVMLPLGWVLGSREGEFLFFRLVLEQELMGIVPWGTVSPQWVSVVEILHGWKRNLKIQPPAPLLFSVWHLRNVMYETLVEQTAGVFSCDSFTPTLPALAPHPHFRDVFSPDLPPSFPWSLSILGHHCNQSNDKGRPIFLPILSCWLRVLFLWVKQYSLDYGLTAVG